MVYNSIKIYGLDVWHLMIELDNLGFKGKILNEDDYIDFVKEVWH